MFDKILLAVGGDEASVEPARVAGRLAATLGVGVTILSVKRTTAEVLGEPYYTDLQSERLGDTQGALARARRAVEEQGGRVDDVELLEGVPAERIVSHAEAGGFSLIVMGTRRRGRLQSALLGSVCGSVAAHSRVPILIAPEIVAGNADDQAD